MKLHSLPSIVSTLYSGTSSNALRNFTLFKKVTLLLSLIYSVSIPLIVLL